MNKWIYRGAASLTALALLSGCQKEDNETKKQLAQLQAQLEAEKAEKNQREAKEREQQAKLEQEQREAQLYEQAKEDAKVELAEKLAAQQKEKQEKQKESQNSTNKTKITEKMERYPATVVTQSGYGELSLRGEPSSSGLKVGSVYDGNEVQVIAKTSKCEVIGNINGCWVKVQYDGTTAYMFDGYLNREVFSQREKAKMQGKNSDDHDEAY